MSDPELVVVGPDDVDALGIHCVGDRKHPGWRAKVDWFRQEHGRGLRILLLLSGPKRKSVGFLEYAPGESTWRAVDAPGCLVVHCVWVKAAGRGLGSWLLREVVAAAEREGRDGVAVVASTGPWCAGPALFEKNGFRGVDRRDPFDLRAWKARASSPGPAFAPPATAGEPGRLVFRTSGQCPYVAKTAIELAAEARAHGVGLKVREIASTGDSRDAPTPYGITSLTLGDRVLADHAISRTRFRNILRQQGLT